jgi:CheY-like chemotaxis protein
VPTFIHRADNDLARHAPPVSRTVLYVEDHPVNVLLMQAMCAKRPHVRLVVATTAAEGLRLAIAEQPELLLLDLRLPDGFGTELLQRLRQIPGLEEVPAVAVTAEDTSQLGGSGFTEVWHKPMDMHATLARLDWLLSRREIERSAAADTAVPAAPGWSRVGSRPRMTAPSPIPFPLSPPAPADAASRGL